MKAFVIFLILVGLLIVAGFFYPSKTRKTPLNDRTLRQGQTPDWIEKTTGKKLDDGAHPSKKSAIPDRRK